MTSHRQVGWISIGILLLAAVWAGQRVYHSWADHEEEEEAVEHRAAPGGPSSTAPSTADEKQTVEKLPAHEEAEAEGEPAARISHDEQGHTLVEIVEAVRERMGLATTQPAVAELRPAHRAYGALEADPGSVFSVRSPVAGYLEAPESGAWPQLGEEIQSGHVLGFVRPRFTPAEQYDITIKLMTAQAEVEEVRADLAAQRASFESKRRLNQQQKIVADRALEEAEARVKADEARLDAAIKTVKLLEGALKSGGESAGHLALSSPRSGQVLEVGAQPGEAVDAAQIVLRIGDFGRLLARVGTPSWPAGEGLPRTARVRIAGMQDAVLTGSVLTEAPQINPRFQGREFLLSLREVPVGLRPGMAVVADLELAGPAATGVVVPRSAVVRFGGAAWVYVESSSGKFVRRQISSEAPVEAGWFVSAGLNSKDSVVVTGAGSLLSEELRSQIESEEEGGE